MPHQAIRRIALAIALAALPGMAGVALAAGSQAGDYRQDMIEEHPAYLSDNYSNPPTYYYNSSPTYSTRPSVTDEYSPGWRGYYRYAYPGDTSGRNTNTSPRCEPLSGAAYVDCLHGSAPGG